MKIYNEDYIKNVVSLIRSSDRSGSDRELAISLLENKRLFNLRFHPVVRGFAYVATILSILISGICYFHPDINAWKVIKGVGVVAGGLSAIVYLIGKIAALENEK